MAEEGRPHDTQRRVSAFAATDLEMVIRANGIDTLVFAGRVASQSTRTRPRREGPRGARRDWPRPRGARDGGWRSRRGAHHDRVAELHGEVKERISNATRGQMKTAAFWKGVLHDLMYS